MQHVEEAGVHSGDSACVLPAPSLLPVTYLKVTDVVRRLGAALGVVGLMNVQLAVADGELYVLEVNPRASRTVPFASKATGVNLVQAACRVMAGTPLAELGLPSEAPPRTVSVKAAVLPFARFPGADPVLGPEMRSTGEVMATAGDLPSAFEKAERAAGRPLPHGGTVFLSVCDADKGAIIPVAAALAGLGFELLATRGTARTLQAAGLTVEQVRKVAEDGDAPSPVDMIRRGRCDLVINTPFGPGARSDGYLIRDAALVHRVPCITTISGAAAAVHAIANARSEAALSLQERIDAEARTA
jgi:carbamoyl-phosphate synthase large subunit